MTRSWLSPHCGKMDHVVNSKDLSKESTHKVIENFYPERNYNPLFRTKAQAYNLGQSLASA
jgi:hypothetical protein